jgi:hypothetical protein
MNAPTRTQELASAATAGVELPPFQLTPYVGGQDLILHGDYFDKIDRLATIMSKAKGAVPRHLLNNPGACFSVALTAVRANFDPFGVARKTWEGPDGTIKYEGQLVIALINNSGLLQDRLNWEYFGPWEKILGKFQWRESKKKEDEHGNAKKYIVKAWDDKDEVGLGVRCYATLKGETEPRVTELLMAQAVVRNSTLWVEDPKQQIGYLSGQRWGRLHTPEAIMGVYTPEEDFEPPRDMGPADVVQPKVDPALLKAGEDAAAKGRAAYTEFWKDVHAPAARDPERAVRSPRAAEETGGRRGRQAHRQHARGDTRSVRRHPDALPCTGPGTGASRRAGRRARRRVQGH